MIPTEEYDASHPAFGLVPRRGPPMELGAVTRLAVEWDGVQFSEIDPGTGAVLAVGDVRELLGRSEPEGLEEGRDDGAHADG